MLIAVNTRLLLPEKLEGIGWFTHGTLSRLVKAHPEHRFVFLFDRPFDRRFIYADNVRGEVVWPPTRHPLLYRLWFEHRLPAVLRRLKADLCRRAAAANPSYVTQSLYLNGADALDRANGGAGA